MKVGKGGGKGEGGKREIGLRMGKGRGRVEDE